MPSATRKSDENMLSQLFPTGKVVRRRRRHSMRHIVQLLSSACLMLFLCLSKTHAVYDEGGVGRPSSSNEQFIAPIHQSNEGSLAQIPEADRLVWEYLAKKYSASGTAFTPSELINMAKSMQKCHGGDTSGKIINSNLVSFILNVSNWNISWHYEAPRMTKLGARMRMVRITRVLRCLIKLHMFAEFNFT